MDEAGGYTLLTLVGGIMQSHGRERRSVILTKGEHEDIGTKIQTTTPCIDLNLSATIQ